MKTLIHNVRFAGMTAPDAWILIDGEFISATGTGTLPSADITVDGHGALAMPGAIDCHVHFREPGMTAKADIASESRAALAGGVTSVLEMPNTKPATTTVELWQQKMDIAAERSAVNYAFFIGATNDNIDRLKAADYTRVPGVKLFMGSSTGNMLVDSDDAIARIFREVPALVAVHAEDQDIIAKNIERMTAEGLIVDGDAPVEMHSRIRSAEACYASSAKAAEIARATGHRLHICHITTAKELSLLSTGPTAERLITGEVSPHHLAWCDDDYNTCPGATGEPLGTRIKMNPAVKTAADREALRRAVEDGRIDIVATDHAPHLLTDKQGGALKATSGAPLVQFSLPWMLTHFDEPTVQRVMCENPATVFGIDRRGTLSPGNYADIVLVEDAEWTVTDADVVSRCGWTPLRGTTLTRRIAKVYLNGTPAFPDSSASPKAIKFTPR